MLITRIINHQHHTVTPAFFGAGMLSGLNASWSFFGGTVLAWGIISPYVVHQGLAVGEQTHPDTYPELWTYTSLTFKDPDRYLASPSPRYWLLWPGVLIMLYAFHFTLSLLFRCKF